MILYGATYRMQAYTSNYGKVFADWNDIFGAAQHAKPSQYSWLLRCKKIKCST